MTDPLATLHGPRRPAPADGLDRALANGRRRLHRRRAATGAVTLSLGVVASATLVGTGDGGGDGLQPSTGDRSGTPTTQAMPKTADDPSPTPLVTASAGVTLPPDVGLPTAVPTPPDNPPAESPTPTEARHYLGRGSRTITVSTTHSDTSCATVGVGLTPRNGWCTNVGGPENLDPGEPQTFTFTLCRGVGEESATRTFSKGEIVVYVSYLDDNDNEVTVWKLDDPAAPHTVSFEPGDCRIYNYDWMGQDDDGYQVGAGRYQVRTSSTADEWKDYGGDELDPAPGIWYVDVS